MKERAECGKGFEGMLNGGDSRSSGFELNLQGTRVSDDVSGEKSTRKVENAPLKARESQYRQKWSASDSSEGTEGTYCA